MLNLTPHTIAVIDSNGVRREFPPSGTLARLVTVEDDAGSMDGIPCVTRVIGKVEGLPEEGVPCLVSSMVLDAVKGRKGVYAPDTGKTAIRNVNGHVDAVTRLIVA